MSTRCYFCATIIIILASLTVFCNCYDVIIIGAGASGIAAGMYLLNNGIDNFIILEAEDRIGGRINSVEFGEAMVDLGAEWCLGEENNTVYSTATGHHILKPVNESYKFMSSDDVWYITQTEKELLECRRNFSDNFLDIPIKKDYATLSDAFFEYYDENIIKQFIKHNPNSTKFFMETLKIISSMALTHESFYSWDDIPAKHNHRKYNGQLQDFNGLGFQSLLEIMMNEFPNSTGNGTIRSKIRHHSEVHKIVWRQENTSDVIVVSTTGNYVAKHVIFTPSLGVLKNTHSTLFEPGLPQDKIDGINCLGFEGIVKVFLKYSNPWWGKEEFQPTLLVWKEVQRTILELNLFGGKPDGYRGTYVDPFSYTKASLGNKDPTWLFALTQLLPSPNNPTVIEAWFTGGKSKEIETIPDEILENGILRVLRSFYDPIRDEIDRPDRILRSYWNTNSHFLGSHSYEKWTPSPVSSSCNEDLSTPLYRNGNDTPPVVLFAGEATSKHHYSTVHGAIEAGEREADRLLLLLAPEATEVGRPNS